MFDIESQIRKWRMTIANSGSITDQNAAELETHLRETISDLLTKGLHEQEAFVVASMRLGTPDEMSNEYSKVNGAYVWKRRIVWMLCGFVGGNALAHAFNGLASLAGATAAFAGFSGAGAGAMSVAATVVCWVILLVMLSQGGRRHQFAAINDSVSIGWLAFFIALMVFGQGLTMVGNMMHVLTASVIDFGQSMYWRSIGGLAINVCVVAASIAMMVAFGERPVEKTERIV